MAQAELMIRPTQELVVVDDAEALAHEAAKRVIARVRESDRPAVCLTGGSTPRRLYELLGAEPLRKQIPWDRVHWFMSDERFVPNDDRLSNIGAARREFLDRLAPRANIHGIPTDLPDPDAAALAYEKDLRAFYGSDRLDPARPLFDVVLLGIGPDGHVASLFPGEPHDTGDRWAIGVARANVAPFVPRITLTFAALASCRQMVFSVSGAEKRAIFASFRRGDDLPASRMQSNQLTTCLVDRAAAGDAA